jgi:hypothetical protein
MEGAWFRATELQFIMIKDGQSMPIFEGEAGGVYSNGKKQELIADIIEVHTVNNAGANTYRNMFYGENTLGVLIPIKESVEKNVFRVTSELEERQGSGKFCLLCPCIKNCRN